VKHLHKQHLNFQDSVSINQLIFFSGKLQETNGPALEDNSFFSAIWEKSSSLPWTQWR